MNSSLTPRNENCLLSVTQFSVKHGWPVGGLRHLIFQNPRGFDRVVRRVGRKVLLDEMQFFQWVEEINGQTSGGAK